MKAVLNFFKTRKQLLLLLYAAVYIPWFIYIEKTVTAGSSYHIIHMAVDDMIPFCEFFVIPYCLWFVYMGFTIAYVLLFDGPSSIRLGIFLYTGMTLFLIISTVYPNGHQLRPDSFVRDNLFVHITQKLYAADTPTNLFPSIHVYNSLGCHFTLLHCKNMAEKKHWAWVRPVSWILLVGITCSTLFLKQHSMFDVLTAFILAAVMYLVCFGPVASAAAKMTGRRKVLKETVQNSKQGLC